MGARYTPTSVFTISATSKISVISSNLDKIFNIYKIYLFSVIIYIQ